MYRKIMSFLEAWKESSHRKPLILQGARQVGKTYSILEFGRTHYENVAYFNFETNPKLNETFNENISPDYLIPILSHIAGQTIVREKTLIVFDEVQRRERALTSLKYFCEDAPDYHIIVAGSLLGVAVNRAKFSFPVGKVDFMTLHPVSFAEYLRAADAQLYHSYQMIDEVMAVPEVLHQQLIDAYEKNDMVFAVGPAGTGKTYLSIALAVKALKEKAIKKIILSRPAVEAGEKLGFLPGDMKDKIDPYLQPLYDALEDMIPAVKLQDMMEKHIIQIAPLAFMRGRTLSDAVVILDEAQNTTSQQIRMFLTRMGMNTKMIITGDLTQIDLPREQRSGLKEALKILDGVEGIGVVKLGQKDIVRHKLVTRIVNAYDKYDKERAEAREAQKAEKDNSK